MKNGGISSANKYAIVEYMGFNQIQNAAHELGHSLGAIHDGTANALACSARSNYIMTPAAGAFKSFNNLYYLIFSNCSVNAFKYTLLASNQL